MDQSNVLPLLVREFSNECECKKTVSGHPRILQSSQRVEKRSNQWVWPVYNWEWSGNAHCADYFAWSSNTSHLQYDRFLELVTNATQSLLPWIDLQQHTVYWYERSAVSTILKERISQCWLLFLRSFSWKQRSLQIWFLRRVNLFEVWWSIYQHQQNNNPLLYHPHYFVMRTTIFWNNWISHMSLSHFRRCDLDWVARTIQINDNAIS